MTCRIDGCDRMAAPGEDLCYGHDRRRRRAPGKGGLALSEPIRDRPKTKKEVLIGAALTLADLKATDDEGWERARDHIVKAAVRYTLSQPRFRRLADLLNGGDSVFNHAGRPAS